MRKRRQQSRKKPMNTGNECTRSPAAAVPDKFIENQLALVIRLPGKFGMKLNSPEKRSVGTVNGFNNAILGLSHFPEAGSQCAYCLMVIAVHAHLIPAKPVKRCSFFDMDGMNGTVIRRLTVVLDTGGMLSGQILI